MQATITGTAQATRIPLSRALSRLTRRLVAISTAKLPRVAANLASSSSVGAGAWRAQLLVRSAGSVIWNSWQLLQRSRCAWTAASSIGAPSRSMRAEIASFTKAQAGTMAAACRDERYPCDRP